MHIESLTWNELLSLHLLSLVHLGLWLLMVRHIDHACAVHANTHMYVDKWCSMKKIERERERGVSEMYVCMSRE